MYEKMAANEYLGSSLVYLCMSMIYVTVSPNICLPFVGTSWK